MSLKAGRSVVIMSAVFVSQLICTPKRRPEQRDRANRSRSTAIQERFKGRPGSLCLAKRFEEGRRLFDEETFQGNGRTCVTCHSVATGTFSPTDAQKRLAADPGDPLFVHDGLDDGSWNVPDH